MRALREGKVGVSIGEATKTCVLLHVSEDVVMSLCVAGVALCDIRRVSGGMCVHDRREGKVGVSIWGKPQKRVFHRVSEEVVMSFCVAGVAVCDI